MAAADAGVAQFSARLTEITLDLNNFNPVEGLSMVPVVSLVVAVQMLQEKDAAMAKINLVARANLAVMFAENLGSDILSVNQVAAIHLYTQECPIYKELNMRLRERNREMLIPFLPYLKLLLSALYLLPLANVQLYRGVKQDLSDMYIKKKGKKIMLWSFTSASFSLEVLASPQFLGDSGPRTMHCINARAVDIREFSAMPQEDERLILPGTCLIVDGVLNAGHGLFTVQLHEAKDTASGLIDFSHPGLSIIPDSSKVLPPLFAHIFYSLLVLHCSPAGWRIPHPHRCVRFICDVVFVLRWCTS